MNSTADNPGRPDRNAATDRLWAALEAIPDPEIPVISIRELGILQDIELQGETVVVTITPTYSGCPAMHEIAQDIKKVLAMAGHEQVVVKSRLSPAWTTDWITPEGAQKLQDYGIAPPVPKNRGPVPCPNCKSSNTKMISEFGSTACKALYKCNDCLEPFDYFKCH